MAVGEEARLHGDLCGTTGVHVKVDCYLRNARSSMTLRWAAVGSTRALPGTAASRHWLAGWPEGCFGLVCQTVSETLKHRQEGMRVFEPGRGTHNAGGLQ